MAETAVMENSHHQCIGAPVESSALCPGDSSRLFHSQHALGQSWCPQRPMPQTLFMEGFNDCASEVVRYLTEVERMDDNNPMLKDLQGHLTRVKMVFCQESMSSEESLEDKTCYLNEAERMAQHSSFMDNMLCKVGCSLSPIVSMSVNSSVSDATSIESDLSSSSASLNCQSITSDLSSSLLNTLHHGHDMSLDAIRHDDVFQQCQHSPCLGPSPVLSLKQLALQAVQRAASNQPEAFLNHYPQHQTRQFQTLPCTSCEGALATSGSLQYVLPIGQSSPVLPSTPSTHCEPNHTLYYHPSHTLTFDSRQQTLGPISPLVINTNVHSNSLPSSYVGDIFQSLNTNPNEQEVPELTKELVQHVSSVLEQRANILSGIDTSIVASGELSDVLLAVETCRFHNDARVRDLADEILHLINDDYADDEFEDTFEDDEEEPHRRNDESGIEMMDESSDWGNPADFLEQ